MLCNETTDFGRCCHAIFTADVVDVTCEVEVGREGGREGCNMQVREEKWEGLNEKREEKGEGGNEAREKKKESGRRIQHGY